MRGSAPNAKDRDDMEEENKQESPTSTWSLLHAFRLGVIWRWSDAEERRVYDDMRYETANYSTSITTVRYGFMEVRAPVFDRFLLHRRMLSGGHTGY